jgi:hypothetical protein
MSGDERCARAACAPYNLIAGMVFATWLLLTPKSSSAADGIEEVAKIQMVVGSTKMDRCNDHEYNAHGHMQGWELMFPVKEGLCEVPKGDTCFLTAIGDRKKMESNFAHLWEVNKLGSLYQRLESIHASQINKEYDRVHTLHHNIQKAQQLFQESSWCTSPFHPLPQPCTHTPIANNLFFRFQSVSSRRYTRVMCDCNRKLWQYTAAGRWNPKTDSRADRWHLLWTWALPVRTVRVPSYILEELKQKVSNNDEAYSSYADKASSEIKAHTPDKS